MNLNELNLGPLDADDDSNIDKYFVQFGEFEDLQNKTKFVMVGVKGTGKSAVRKYLSTKEKHGGKFVIELDDSYNIPSKQMKDIGAIEITNRMESFLIKLILHYLLKEGNLESSERQKLNKINYPFFKKIIKTLQDTSVDFYVKTSLQELFSQEQSEISEVLNTKTIETLQSVIGKNEVWIFIDDIHKVFSLDDADASLRFVEGLIYLASNINIRTFDRKVNVVLFVRSEIYQDLLLIAEELDKETQYIWNVEWDKNELINFLSARIAWGFKVERDDPLKIWKLLFEANTNKEISEIQNYIIERVINGPRDMLLLVDEARKHAASNQSSKISLGDIKASEYDYGEEKLFQINRNYQRIYEEIKYILEKYFRGTSQKTNRKEIQDLFKKEILQESKLEWIRKSTPFNFIQVLYKIGFIGYLDSPSNHYIFSLEKPKMGHMANDCQLKIHDAFVAYLELQC